MTKSSLSEIIVKHVKISLKNYKLSVNRRTSHNVPYLNVKIDENESILV